MTILEAIKSKSPLLEKVKYKAFNMCNAEDGEIVESIIFSRDIFNNDTAILYHTPDRPGQHGNLEFCRYNRNEDCWESVLDEDGNESFICVNGDLI